MVIYVVFFVCKDKEGQIIVVEIGERMWRSNGKQKVSFLNRSFFFFFFLDLLILGCITARFNWLKFGVSRNPNGIWGYYSRDPVGIGRHNVLVNVQSKIVMSSTVMDISGICLQLPAEAIFRYYANETKCKNRTTVEPAAEGLVYHTVSFWLLIFHEPSQSLTQLVIGLISKRRKCISNDMHLHAFGMRLFLCSLWC